jgi:hypothetical protein
MDPQAKIVVVFDEEIAQFLEGGRVKDITRGGKSLGTHGLEQVGLEYT